MVDDARMWSTEAERANAPDGWYVHYFQPGDEGVEIMIGPYASPREAERSALDHEWADQRSAFGGPSEYMRIAQRLDGCWK